MSFEGSDTLSIIQPNAWVIARLIRQFPQLDGLVYRGRNQILTIGCESNVEDAFLMATIAKAL